MNQPASPLDSLKPLAGRALEIALNRLLALDADSRAALAALDGRRVRLALSAPPLALAITVRGDRLGVGPADSDADAEPDLAVRGSISGLLGQLPFLRDSRAATGGRMHVSGDAELAQRLQKIARGFSPDWNLAFAEVFGEVLGEAIGKALKQALGAGLDSAKTFSRDAADYLTEETREVIGRDELERFHDDVDTLRDDAERLAVRVARLVERASEPTP